MMKRYVLIVAGGRGLRMGSDLPKQFIPMEGKPVLMHTFSPLGRVCRSDPGASGRSPTLLEDALPGDRL